MKSHDLLRQKLDIIEKTSSAVVATDNVKAVADLMLDLAIDHTSAEKGSLMLLDEQDELYILAARGIDEDLVNVYRTKIGEGIAGKVAENQSPVLVKDLAHEERFAETRRDQYKTRSFISCPIQGKRGLLGILNINDKKDGKPFTEDEFSLLRIIANQAASALENANLMTQLRLKAFELEEKHQQIQEIHSIETDFFLRMAHETRTPLNAIKGAVSFLRRAKSIKKAQREEFIKIIGDETGRLEAIVQRSLEFLRLKNESPPAGKTELRLGDVITELHQSRHLQEILDQRKLQFQFNVPPDLPTLFEDKDQVYSFFRKIIDGMTSFLEPGDHLRLEVDDPDILSVVIAVSRKLPESFLSRLFHPICLFEEEGEELGIKFYSVLKIAEANGWHLRFDGDDEGSYVRISMPGSVYRRKRCQAEMVAETYLEIILKALNAEDGCIMLVDDLSGALVPKCLGRGMVKAPRRMSSHEAVCGWVHLEGKPFFPEGSDSAPPPGMMHSPKPRQNFYMYLPIRSEGEVKGVFYMTGKRTGKSFNMADFWASSAFVEHLARFIDAVDRAPLHEAFQEREHFLETAFGRLENGGWKNSIDVELLHELLIQLEVDDEDKKHTFSALAALYLALPGELDDFCGKSSSKRLNVSGDPSMFASLLSGETAISDQAKTILRHCREHFDGTGAPGGFKGKEIPIGSRILAVIVALKRLTCRDGTHGEMSVHEALKDISNKSGSIYDPAVVRALEQALKRSRIVT